MNELTKTSLYLSHMDSDELYHYGILGMKWGVRRYQPYGQGYQSKTKGRTVGEASRYTSANAGRGTNGDPSKGTTANVGRWMRKHSRWGRANRARAEARAQQANGQTSTKKSTGTARKILGGALIAAGVATMAVSGARLYSMNGGRNGLKRIASRVKASTTRVSDIARGASRATSAAGAVTVEGVGRSVGSQAARKAAYESGSYVRSAGPGASAAMQRRRKAMQAIGTRAGQLRIGMH